ncbi:MAG: phosphatase PAP2 family protein [Patescibacteria group bacterium]
MSKGTKRTVFAHIISMIGSWWGILVVTGLVYLLSPIPKEKLLFFIVWIFAPTIIAELIKFIIKRPRPAARGEAVKVKAYGYSFPSSHTVAAFMIASWVMLVPELRWWSYLFIAWPFIVGWSRVWLRAHDTIDVVGGFVFGTLATFLLVLV